MMAMVMTTVVFLGSGGCDGSGENEEGDGGENKMT